MAELLSAGVFIEEIPSQVQVITAVSTSNVGAVGYTPRGPEDTATLVTSFDSYTRKFGPIVAESFLGLSIAAFYANGGKRAFIVRVVPADATAADVNIRSTTTDQEIETGDGGTAVFSQTAATSLLKDNDGASPVVPSSFSLRWRGEGSAVGTPVATRNRDNVGSPVGTSGDVAQVNGQDSYECQINPKAQDTVAGGAPTGDITYYSVGDGRNDITVTQVAADPVGASVVGTAVTVNIGTGPSNADVVVAAVNATNGLPVTAEAAGTGVATAAAAGAATLAGGTPSYDPVMDRLIQDAVFVVWDPDGVGDRDFRISKTWGQTTPELWTITGLTGAALNAGAVDGETFQIDDGVNPPTVFEWDLNSAGVTPGNVSVPFTAVDPLPVVLTNIETAINGVSTLDVTSESDAFKRVMLSHDTGGTITITESVTLATFEVGTKFQFDHSSGKLSLKFTQTDIPDGSAVGPIRVAYIPTNGPIGTNATDDRTWHVAADDGAGALTSVDFVGAGSIVYADGEYDFETTAGATPHDEAAILATYDIDAWELNPISRGTWGNDLRVDMSGNDDFLDSGTAAFSRFDVNILLRNASGAFEIQESYEELDFSDSTAATYFADVLNELSDLVSVEEPAGDEPPGQLSGIVRRNIIAAGNELAGSKQIDGTLTGPPVAARSVVISYTDNTGTARTITDNGSGNLVGDIDAAGLNTITYANGNFDVTLVNAAQGGSLVVVSYASAAEEATHVESFGDATKGYDVGTDGTFADRDYYGRDQFTSPLLSPSRKGLYALDRVDELMQVIVPDFAGDQVVTLDLLDYADGRSSQPSGGDRFIILTTPRGSDAQEAVDWFQFTLNRFSIWAALYWPWVKVADPLASGRPLTMPPLGHLAGIYARTDATKSVGKAPGGTVDGALRFLIGLESEPDQGERDFVYPKRINPLISSPQTGLAVWGVRTIASPSQTEWRYIQARRLFMFLEKSIFNSTHWIVFENNGPALWSRISAQLNSFLTNLHNQGLFAGATPSESFKVTVDNTNNTPESIENGEVIIDVAAAPNKPAEFVRFRFTQKSLT